MSHRKKLWLIITIPLFILIAGCAPECTEEQIDHKYPWNLQPADKAIVSSLTPTFEWSWGTDCNPYRFIIKTSKDTSSTFDEHEVNGSQREYTISPSLDPGSKYFWSMHTKLSDQYIGLSTADHIFYTEPLCSGAPTVAPILDTPEDGAYVTPTHYTNELEFHWHYPDACLPSSFLYEFATDPNFQNIIASGETQDHSQFVSLTFPDCTKIYWHVAAKTGNQAGPFSATHTFSWIEDPKCWMNHYPSDEVGLIRGQVYLDLCPQTKSILPVNTPLADGCIQTSGFGITANGDIDYNEGAEFKPHPGLYNVQVDLGEGACPSTGLDQDMTGAQGRFSFTVLTPGTYCLSVSKNQTGHQVETGLNFNLLGGLWTEPLTKAVLAEYTITLGEGWSDVKYYFGWDKYDAFVKPFVFEKLWCRWRPYPPCDPLHLFEIGEAAPMLARNAEGSWIMTSYEGETCYFYNSFFGKEDEITVEEVGIPVAEYLAKFEALEVFDPPPPCPEPEPEPKPKPDSPEDTCAGKSERSCIADPACVWKYSAVGPGYCTSK